MKPKRSLRVLLTLLALAVTTAPALESSAFARDNKRQTKQKEAAAGRERSEKRKDAKQGKRDENGHRPKRINHDNPDNPGGSNNDKHQKGYAQAKKAQERSKERQNGNKK